MRYKNTYFFLFLAALLALNSCGTHRNTPISKFHHNMNVLFNGYYNGQRKWKRGVDEVNMAYELPNEGLIPVQYYGDEESLKAGESYFTTAIEKAEAAIIRHKHQSPKAKNRWIDDCVFLIGRSWFYKANYILAIEKFNYVIENWPKSKIIPEVYLWLVRAHYYNGTSVTAERLLKEIVPKLELKKRQKGELALLKAELAMQKEKLDETVSILEKNLDLIKGRRNKARVHYLLGQIYAKQGKVSKSYENFKRVTKLNTDYKFIFNAQLQIVHLFVDNQAEDGQQRKLYKLMRKMLRDEKNTEYKDQIYYEWALLELKRGNQDKGIEQLENSVAASVSNQRQKALSYYKLGQIYFYDIQNFDKAGNYFDSASSTITKDAPEYKEISRINKTLQEYLKYTSTIQLQDSLLQLASLSDKALDKAIDKIIKLEQEKEAEEQRKMLEEIDRFSDPNLFNQQNQNRNNNSGFYFNDPQAVANGKIEFERIWGKRKNDDNWRRKNKSFGGGDDPELTDNNNLSGEEKYKKMREDMYNAIPRTPEEKKIANDKILKAMFELGQLYSNRLDLPEYAITTFKKLLVKYPSEEEYTLKTKYALYQLYQKSSSENAKTYREEICAEAPESNYCRWCKGEQIEQGELFKDFNSALTALVTTFGNEDYKTVIEFSDYILQKYPAESRLPKVYYMQGSAYGYLGNKTQLKTIFTKIKTDYPEAEITPRVVATLALMDGKSSSNDNSPKPQKGDGEQDIDQNDERYKGFTKVVKQNEKLYVVMLIKKENIATHELQQKINQFNKKQSPNKLLNASIFLYQKTHHLVYISQFEGQVPATEYLNAAEQDENIQDAFKDGEDKMMFISPTNFREAYSKGRFDDYFLYFENFLQQ